jgi:hypothetical protein
MEVEMTESGSRAVLFDHYGERDVLYVADVPMPTPDVGEVVVAVKAAGINPGETAIRSGALHDRFPATFPSGEGSDLAGIVSAVGDGVDDFTVGDAVLGFSWRRSSHAAYVSVPTTQLIHKPTELSWEVAGSLYVVGCTAYAAVRAVDAKGGDMVAVSAAAGGVGTVVVQLLALRGSHVLGIASPANDDWLRSHGAVPVPYGDGLAERLRTAARLPAVCVEWRLRAQPMPRVRIGPAGEPGQLHIPRRRNAMRRPPTSAKVAVRRRPVRARPRMNLAGERQPGLQVSPIREQNVARGPPRSPGQRHESR